MRDLESPPAGRYELTSRPRPAVWLLAMGVAALLVLMLVGCSGDDDSDEAVPSAGGDNASGDEGAEPAGDSEQELLDWVECMRDQGVDIPDPEVDADGNLGFPEGIQITGDGSGASPEEAQAECGDIPEGAARGGGGERMDQSELEDTVLEYAQCMRDNGVDMPDPEIDGGRVTMGGPGSGLDQNDPAFQEAQEACQDIMSGLGGGPGAGSSGAG